MNDITTKDLVELSNASRDLIKLLTGKMTPATNAFDIAIALTALGIPCQDIGDSRSDQVQGLNTIGSACHRLHCAMLAFEAAPVQVGVRRAAGK